MKSPRNKTLTINPEELQQFTGYFTINGPAAVSKITNNIILGDAVQQMQWLPTGKVDLIITDPPYNLNKNFGQGTINLSKPLYREWCGQWIQECARLLKPTGSIYVCMDWPSSGMIQELLEKHFIVRNRITWKRDKGRGAKKNWKNNMEDIWFATKSADYVFNLDAVKIKKPVIAPYVDKTGRPKDWFEENGQKFRYTAPANIWTDLIVPFWSMPENTEHPTQKPEKLFERLILASSNEHDLIFDPFLGSGTAATAAKRLKRNYCGFEIEKKYYLLARKRLAGR